MSKAILDEWIRRLNIGEEVLFIEIENVVNYEECLRERLNEIEKEDNRYTILGHIYFKEGNSDEAKRYYMLAIEKGNVLAMLNIGFLLYNDGNKEEAIKYYDMAIKNGCKNAIFGLAKLYQDDGDRNKAIIYYEMALKVGDDDAMNNLGSLYAGEGNIEEAKKYFRMAIEKGNVVAMRNMMNDMEEQEKIFKRIVGRRNELEEEIKMKNQEIEELKRENAELKACIDFSPEGDGYEKAKEDFERLREGR